MLKFEKKIRRQKVKICLTVVVIFSRYVAFNDMVYGKYFYLVRTVHGFLVQDIFLSSEDSPN